MVRKKQIITMVSIAVVVLLIGTSFNVVVMAGWKEDLLREILYWLYNKVNNLESRIETLENQSIPQGFVSAPAYDSGWVSIDIPGTEFVHNLGTTEVLVYIIGRHPIVGIHQLSYGGDYSADYGSIGLCWAYLTPTTIVVFRSSDDPYWTEVRVMMWKIR